MIMTILGSFKKPFKNMGVSGHISYTGSIKPQAPKPHILAIPQDSSMCIHVEINDVGKVERCREKADLLGKHGFLCLNHMNKH